MEPEPSSPVCFAAQGDYRGYAGREELARAIPALIEAEQALARQADALAPCDARPLLDTIRTDAAHGCAVLADALRRLGEANPAPEAPSPDTASSVCELQGSLRTIVSLLHALLPRIRDEHLRGQLAGLRGRHVRSREALEQPASANRRPAPGTA